MRSVAKNLGWVVAGALAAAPLAGCGGPGTRSYAVVLAEPELLDCALVVPSDNVNVETAAQIFASVTTEWRARWDAGLLRPAGGELHVVHEGEQALAWLGELPEGTYAAWNGVVFEGERHDDHVDADNVTTLVTNEDACGVLVTSENEMLATVDGAEIDGRIRRVQYWYVPSAASSCAGHVECARNIAMNGVLEE